MQALVLPSARSDPGLHLTVRRLPGSSPVPGDHGTTHRAHRGARTAQNQVPHFFPIWRPSTWIGDRGLQLKHKV